MQKQRRSECPINFSLEIFGDTWSLLIIRDIVYFGKRTYREFLDSDEGIATNILASRLAHLENEGILAKSPHATDQRKVIYSLTEKGLDLIPLVFEMAAWGAAHDPLTSAPAVWLAAVRADRERIIQLTREIVRRGGSVFVGPDSVFSQVIGQPAELQPKI